MLIAFDYASWSCPRSVSGRVLFPNVGHAMIGPEPRGFPAECIAQLRGRERYADYGSCDALVRFLVTIVFDISDNDESQPPGRSRSFDRTLVDFYGVALMLGCVEGGHGHVVGDEAAEPSHGKAAIASGSG